MHNAVHIFWCNIMFISSDSYSEEYLQSVTVYLLELRESSLLLECFCLARNLSNWHQILLYSVFLMDLFAGSWSSIQSCKSIIIIFSLYFYSINCCNFSKKPHWVRERTSAMGRAVSHFIKVRVNGSQCLSTWAFGNFPSVWLPHPWANYYDIQRLPGQYQVWN